MREQNQDEVQVYLIYLGLIFLEIIISLVINTSCLLLLIICATYIKVMATKKEHLLDSVGITLTDVHSLELTPLWTLPFKLASLAIHWFVLVFK